MNSRVAFYTLGCKLNYSETSTIGNQFLKNGFDIVDFTNEADVYLINSCTVTKNADRECRQIVRRALRKNPNAFVAVTGCYAQLRPEEISKIEGVDAVLGSKEKFEIFSIVENFAKKNLSCIYVSPVDDLQEFQPAHSTDADNRTRAFYKIQDGCDYNCSFCTIPLARGKSHSMHPEEVISQFKELLKSGYKEIILTGVNVGDYGESYQENFYQILQTMVKIPGDYRIRISSIEPNLLSDEILNLTAETDKLCKHFHIPLQSGSSKILRLMQRRYTSEEYRGVVFKTIEKIPDVGIGVDVIVGFPGETEQDFIDTYNFIQDLPVAYLHVFTYSERPNTKATELNSNVDVVERKRRNNMLRILSDKKKNQFYRRMIGKDVVVLFEKENSNGCINGFTSNYVRVKHKYYPELINKLVSVTISDVENNICIADKQTKTINNLAG